MGMFDSYRMKKSISTLLVSPDPASPEVVQAATTLKQIGRSAIPKLLEAVGKARQSDTLVAVLVQMVDHDSLPLFGAALAGSSPRVVAAVVEVLSRSDSYDPHRLFGLFANPKIAREHIEQILVCRKDRLQPEALLRLLSTMSQGDYPIVFRLLDQVATKAFIPELIHRLRTEDWIIRFHIARILSRFRTEAVRDTLVRLLSDSHKNVRLIALEGLAAMRVPFDVGPLCTLLRDPEATIQRKAMDMVLSGVQDDADDIRKRAVKALVAMHDASVFKGLFAALQRVEWPIIMGITDTLGRHGGRGMVERILALLDDPDRFIQRCAFETLQTIKDDVAFDALVEALKTKEIRERTVNALAALGDKRVVPMFLRMLECDAEASLIATRALVALGEPQALPPLLVQLQHPDLAVRREVLRALAVLTNEEYAPDVLQAVMAVRDSAEDELRELANQMATTIIKRFGQRVMPQSVLAQAAVSTARTTSAEALTVVAPGLAGFTRAEREDAELGDLGRAQALEATIDVTTLEPGMVLAQRYRVVRRVGQGGFSFVFLVDDTMVHEQVILKILNPQVALDNDMIKRFIHELRYARMVTHENVIRIHDFISLGKSYAISMEYFPSHNLDDELRQGTPLSLRRGLKIIWDICRGIGAAHQANVVHRDLKPPNILINDSGIVKIVDFGVAAVTSDMTTRLTRVGTVLGTPTYMAPEQVRCRTVDARTDIYSLGVIMYEMFTGKKPYTGDVMSVLFQHVEGKAVPPRQVDAGISPVLEAIILKAMAVDPDDRFQSIEDLRKSLVAFTRQKP